MTIIITSTTKVVDLNGIPARIWEGKTLSGVPVHAFISRIGCPKDADQREFQQELDECKAPSREIELYPARMII